MQYSPLPSSSRPTSKLEPSVLAVLMPGQHDCFCRALLATGRLWRATRRCGAARLYPRIERSASHVAGTDTSGSSNIVTQIRGTFVLLRGRCNAARTVGAASRINTCFGFHALTTGIGWHRHCGQDWPMAASFIMHPVLLPLPCSRHASAANWQMSSHAAREIVCLKRCSCRSVKDPATGDARGVSGSMLQLSKHQLSEQPVSGFHWNADKIGLFCAVALDQTLRVGLVTKLHLH